jgi:TolB-like protein
MSDKNWKTHIMQKFVLFFVSAFLLPVNRTNAQELVVVMDLVITSNISKNTMDSACNKIGKEIARDKQYFVFDRQFLPVTLEQAGARQLPCSETGCLTDAGKLLGAKYIIGGSLYLAKGILEVTLKRVDVGSGKSVQTVQWKSQGAINFFLNEKIPFLVQEMMTDSTPGATTTISKKTSKHPFAWIGMSTLAVVGGGAAAYLYYKKGQTTANGDLPLDDVPVHAR